MVAGVLSHATDSFFVLFLTCKSFNYFNNKHQAVTAKYCLIVFCREISQLWSHYYYLLSIHEYSANMHWLRFVHRFNFTFFLLFFFSMLFNVFVCLPQYHLHRHHRRQCFIIITLFVLLFCVIMFSLFYHYCTLSYPILRFIALKWCSNYSP